MPDWGFFETIWLWMATPVFGAVALLALVALGREILRVFRS